MLSPEKRKQMDMVLGKTQPSNIQTTTQPSRLSPERRKQMDMVLGKTQQTMPTTPQNASTGNYFQDVAKNIVPSAKRFVGDIANVVTNPLETAKTLGKTALGTAQLLVPGEQQYEAYPKEIGKFYKQRYGGLENIKETFRTDPVGVLADISTIASAGSGTLRAGSKVTSAAGKASTAEKLSQVARGLETIESTADPLRIATRATGFAIKPIFNKVTPKIRETLAETSRSTITAGLGNPQKLGQAISKIDEPLVSFWDRNNLWSRDPEIAQDAINAVDEAYKGTVKKGETANISDVVNAYDNLKSKYTEDAKRGSDTAQEIINRIEERKQKFVDSVASTGEVQTPTVTSQELLKQKQAVQRDVPSSKFQQFTPLTAKQEADKAIGVILREELEKASPGTKKLGREESALIGIQEVFSKYENRANARQTLNFTKLGGASVGAILKGIPGAIGGIVLESIVNSPQGTKIIAKTLNTLSKAEFNWLNNRLNEIRKIYPTFRNVTQVTSTFRRD